MNNQILELLLELKQEVKKINNKLNKLDLKMKNGLEAIEINIDMFTE